METYIGVKIVHAEPREGIGRKSYAEVTDLSRDIADLEDGYRVQYKDGYASWCPKDTFEKANFKIVGKNGIDRQDIENFIKTVQVSTIGKRTTVVVVELINGYKIIESASCIDSSDYSELIGKEKCMKKVREKVWFLLGFLLQSALSGFKTE